MTLRTYHDGPDECTQAFEGMHIGQSVSNTLINNNPVATDQWASAEMSPPHMNVFGHMPNASPINVFPSQPDGDWGRGYEAGNAADDDRTAELEHMRARVAQLTSEVEQRNREMARFEREARERQRQLGSSSRALPPMVFSEDVEMDEATPHFDFGEARSSEGPNRGRSYYRGGSQYRGSGRSSARQSSRSGRPAEDAKMASYARSSSTSHPYGYARGGRATESQGSHRGRHQNMSYRREMGEPDASYRREIGEPNKSYRHKNGEDRGHIADEMMEFQPPASLAMVKHALRQCTANGMYAAVWKMTQWYIAALGQSDGNRDEIDQFVIKNWDERNRPAWYLADRRAHRKGLAERGWLVVPPNHDSPLDDWYAYYARDQHARYDGLKRTPTGKPDTEVLEGLVLALRIAYPATPTRVPHKRAILDLLASIFGPSKAYADALKRYKIAVPDVTINIRPFDIGDSPLTEQAMVEHVASCGIQLMDTYLSFREWARYWMMAMKPCLVASDAEATQSVTQGTDTKEPTTTSGPRMPDVEANDGVNVMEVDAATDVSA